MGRRAATRDATEAELMDLAKAVFIAGLTDAMSITAAAEAAGVDRSTVYKWRELDEEFAAVWDEALESGADRLEDEATHRARHGIDEPIVYQGRLTPVWEHDEQGEVVMAERRVPQPPKNGKPQPDLIERVPVQARDEQGHLRWLTVRKPSDSLLMFLLRARRPDKYRERVSTELTGKDGKDLHPVPSGVLVVPGLAESAEAWSAAVQRAAIKAGGE